ncbi:MAG: hypothetical protein AAGE61_15510 [Pseudomonadota bacterium]
MISPKLCIPALQTAGLTVLIALATGDPALADACKIVQPWWSAEDGRMSVIGEAMRLILTGGTLFLVIATALAVKASRIWFALVVALAWLATALFHTIAFVRTQGIVVEAREQGCIGDPTLAIVLFAAAGLALIAWQTMIRKRVIRERS